MGDKQSTQMHTVRLDKWLWATRFYKTRTRAREMIDGGKVHYNGQRTKPGKLVELGATIRVQQGNDKKTVIVASLQSLRQCAQDAQQLYIETQESINRRQQITSARKLNALTMPHPNRRPDKKERRHLIKFKHLE